MKTVLHPEKCGCFFFFFSYKKVALINGNGALLPFSSPCHNLCFPLFVVIRNLSRPVTGQGVLGVRLET